MALCVGADRRATASLTRRRLKDPQTSVAQTLASSLSCTLYLFKLFPTPIWYEFAPTRGVVSFGVCTSAPQTFIKLRCSATARHSLEPASAPEQCPRGDWASRLACGRAQGDQPGCSGTAPTPTHRHGVGVSSSTRRLCVVTVSSMALQAVVSLSSPRRRGIVALSALRRRDVTRSSSPCRRRVVGVSSSRRQLPAVCRRVVVTTSSGRRRTVVAPSSRRRQRVVAARPVVLP
jgi:hypothetical protein